MVFGHSGQMQILYLEYYTPRVRVWNGPLGQEVEIDLLCRNLSRRENDLKDSRAER